MASVKTWSSMATAGYPRLIPPVARRTLRLDSRARGRHPELPAQEGVDVGGLVGLLRRRLALAVAGPGLDPHQHRPPVAAARSPTASAAPNLRAWAGSTRLSSSPGQHQRRRVAGALDHAVVRASRPTARRTRRPTSGSPYSGVHSRAMRNRGKRTMSVSGTAHTTARHRSGRWVSVAATSRPAVAAAPDRQPVAARCGPPPPASRRRRRSRRTPAACARACRRGASPRRPRRRRGCTATAKTPPSSATATAAGL